MDLFDKENRFNLANIITFGNIACGIVAMYLIQQGNFFVAIVLAWIAGALDIADGKVARKMQLSTEFGIQLDSLPILSLSWLCRLFYFFMRQNTILR